MRHAIRQLLDSEPAIEIVGEATNFTTMIEQAAELKPKIVLMDLHMKDESQFQPEFIKSALRDSAECVLTMSLWRDEEAIELSKSYGASTLLDKGNLTDNLIPAIKNQP
jgi:DNA-binding NarL/FixJ family response regulator